MLIVLGTGAILWAPATAQDGASAPRARAPAPPLFEQPLPDVPGRGLRADRLTLGDASIPPHRHAGSVYIYVLEGAAAFQLEGQPEIVVEAGGSFFEPPGVRHLVARSAEPSRRAVVLAVSITPEGQPQGSFD